MLEKIVSFKTREAFILRHSNTIIGKNKMINLLVSFWFVLISTAYANTCLNRSGFFAPNGAYDLNRQAMLSTLPSNVTANDGFYTTSTGQDPNRVYGLGMCFPGTEAGSCSDCIIAASNGLVHNCTTQTEAIDWRMYRNTLCLVRYSNRSFYGSLDMQIIRSNNYTRDFQFNMTDLEITWEALMIGLIDQASSLYYAARTQKLESSTSHVYGVVQCSRDLSLQNCTRCLQQNVIEYTSCCRGTQGGTISRPSCFVRWEVYPFLALLDNMPPLEKDGKGVSTGTIVAIVIVPILLLSLGFAIWMRRKSHKALITTASSLQFDFKAIEAATSNFHNINKLGHGGFGEVYKGTFPNGTEIAVKRLSKTSGQGEREFKNEVLLVAKLQHRNLVRLLGFCVQGEEKLLVYEFLPNKSLNYFLFGGKKNKHMIICADSAKRSQLDWTRRYKIIGGITRGILYLHQDSRLTIIHRDLKASNILLDADMNPKIADFGMARNFRMDQTEDNTGRVVGTFGYMPPEYVANGQFSTKSDVYSFGVLILEIIGGKKNSSFHEIDGSTGNLVTYVWRLWNNDSLLELVDPVTGDNYDKYEVIRCVHIGLLCVQENPTNRPSMFTICQMLTNTSITLPVPQPPGFFFRVRSENIPLAESFQPAPSSSMSIACSVNDATITCVSPR
ncbi:cysteine-rich receptor-like protein kinase 24 [Brassica napus]|uniref:cysteine-rich receptor-like protein kinase 24 n=1 Tax=Brassica napus TaxID=3708 RepID=UPI0020790061|nr:cysteine-rich receptor-like protein kinase 24 [Brassica napus]